jgi:hypothetical protein
MNTLPRILALLTALTLGAATPAFAASPAAPASSKTTAPQGEDPPGADSGDQSAPPTVEHQSCHPRRGIWESTRKCLIRMPEHRKR